VYTPPPTHIHILSHQLSHPFLRAFYLSAHTLNPLFYFVWVYSPPTHTHTPCRGVLPPPPLIPHPQPTLSGCTASTSCLLLTLRVSAVTSERSLKPITYSSSIKNSSSKYMQQGEGRVSHVTPQSYSHVCVCGCVGGWGGGGGAGEDKSLAAAEHTVKGGGGAPYKSVGNSSPMTQSLTAQSTLNTCCHTEAANTHRPSMRRRGGVSLKMK